MSRESVKSDPDFLPAASFVNRVLAEFADLRQYLCEMAAHGVGCKESNQRVPVPAMKDEEGSHQFCLGSPVPRGESSSSATSEEDGDEHEDDQDSRHSEDDSASQDADDDEAEVEKS